ncbi:helix-turn-helix transcriptional regulator [Maridesulfovibrio sp.]|uniref:helix-turn-helix domain-containing protein n=1 Tax=Maridesulfovibrio sp. TaxID=2795000 RepID=UPI0029C9B90A|nr:helix-turn-helix transcriptional regulator [Maridesulfovibrio sp.]
MFSGTDIYKRIEQVKNELNLSNKALAEQGKTTDRTIINIKSGSSTPNAKILYHWCENLGLNINWLLTGVGEMFSANVGSAEEMLPSLTKKLMFVEQSMDKASSLAKLEAMKAVIEGEILAEKNMQPIDGDDRAATG